MTNPSGAPKWDVFISYASEDRAEVARPLAEALSELGLKVWFDQTELKVGDSLRAKIDEGLAQSKYGIVVLSQAFFRKHYPVRELNGLAQRELNAEKVLLPVWYGVSEREVREQSPPLADRIAARWEDGLETVKGKLLQVLGSDLLTRIQELAAALQDLPQITSGSQLLGVLENAHAHSFVHDEFETADEVNIVATFLEELEDWIDALDDIGAGRRAELSFQFTQTLQRLQSIGWKVFGATVIEPMGKGIPGDWRVACLAIVRERRRAVARMAGQFLLADAKDQPAAPEGGTGANAG